MAFFIELHADRHDNRGYTASQAQIIEAEVFEDGGLKMLRIITPEIAANWPVIRANAHGGWAEVAGPARHLSEDEWAAMVAQLQPRR